MLRALRFALAAVAIVYIGLCSFLFFYQRSLIYFPQPGSGEGGGNVLTLPTTEARVLVSTRPKDSSCGLVYFGGNAEDVSLSAPDIVTAFPDCAIYLLHYRGYGGSSGSPTEKAIFADALAVFDEAHRDHPEAVVVGRSLGSGVAVYVASLRPVARLVLVTPYNSVQDLAASQFPYFPVSWILRDKFESWKYAPQVKAPTLILAAEHDEIVPRANSELLLSHFSPGLATLKVVAGVGHNSISARSEYPGLLRGAQ